MINSYIPGEWNAVCDQCGLRVKASKLTKRWDGLMVHSDPSYGCLETRHPQDFVKAVKDSPALPWTRAEVDGDVSLDINCDNMYQIDIPYLLEVDQDIYKGFTSAPPSGVLIQSPAIITVHCTWTIE